MWIFLSILKYILNNKLLFYYNFYNNTWTNFQAYHKIILAICTNTILHMSSGSNFFICINFIFKDLFIYSSSQTSILGYVHCLDDNETKCVRVKQHSIAFKTWVLLYTYVSFFKHKPITLLSYATNVKRFKENKKKRRRKNKKGIHWGCNEPKEGRNEKELERKGGRENQQGESLIVDIRSSQLKWLRRKSACW